MGGETSMIAPGVAPLSGASVAFVDRQEHSSNFDGTVNALSFGFVATAVLILMFLVTALFERLFRPRSSASAAPDHRDLEAQMMFDGKLGYPSPKMSIYSKGVSVLMPGEDIPTFIAHPAPRPPEVTSRPLNECNRVSLSSSNFTTS